MIHTYIQTQKTTNINNKICRETLFELGKKNQTKSNQNLVDITEKEKPPAEVVEVNPNFLHVTKTLEVIRIEADNATRRPTLTGSDLTNLR